MGWFSDQLKDRRNKDNEYFDDSLKQIRDAIIGNGFAKLNSQLEITENTLEEVLKYFGYSFKHIDLGEDNDNFDKRLSFTCSQYGVNYRSVELDEKWYKKAIGPFIGELLDGTKVAIIPNVFGRYSFIDYNTGTKYKLNRYTAKMLKREAILFYKPLPLKKLSIKDLMVYTISQLNGLDFALYFLMMALTTALGFLSPMFTKWLFQDVIETESLKLLIALAVFMVSYSVCSLLFGIVSSLVDTRISMKCDVALETATMNRIINLPATFFKDYSSGELYSRAYYVQSFCSSLLFSVAGTVISSLFSLTYLFQVSMFAGELVLPSLLITLTTIALSTISTFVQMKISKKRMELSAKVTGLTYSTITGIQKIKLSGSEKRMFARWGTEYAKEARLNYNPPTFLKINGTIITAISLAGTLVLYYLAGSNSISVSNYYAFLTSYGMISGAFTSLASIISTIAGIKPTLEMAKPILEATPEVSEGKKVVTDFTGGINFNNVSFRYAENLPLVVDDLSLRIRKGEYVAIVGPTGCGKSTLVRLILGFETPTAGTIFFDRNDMSTIDLRSLRKNIGTVMQNSNLFTGDIYSNITITAPSLTLDEAMEVADMACIGDDIREMPMGMQTLISEGQGGVSGGQKQRLLIARALASKPKILIFDEATSALDNITQKKITESIDQLKCTRIVIAHRLSTIKNADRILYLDKGKIVEDGTYEQLIAKNGLFAELVERQRIDK